MSKILYPVGTEVAITIRVVSKPVKLIVAAYAKGSHTPYKLKRADGKKSDHLKTARYNVGQLISWNNHKSNKNSTRYAIQPSTPVEPDITRDEVKSLIADALDNVGDMIDESRMCVCEVEEIAESVLNRELNRPVDESR